MTHKVDRHTALDGEPLAITVRAILQFQARQAAARTALVNDSGGDPGVFAAVPVLAATEASGSNLAQKTATETALGTVRNALATLFASTNAIATSLGLGTITYSGGGTDGEGTIAAVGQTVTDATTGVQVTGANTVFGQINNAMYVLATQVNKLAAASGKPGVPVETFRDALHVTTIPAMTTNSGTAAAPAVSKADMDAALAVCADNVATLAVAVNAVVAGAGAPGAIAI